MRAMLLREAGRDLEPAELDVPEPGAEEVRIRVAACGVCRTDLHIRDGELADPELPLILGHEIVGRVDALGGEVTKLKLGQRVGVPWLGGTCGSCAFCRADRENLCDRPRFTGYQRSGGYAEYALADSRYCIPLPDEVADVTDAEVAPLLCAGLIGFRAYRMVGMLAHQGGAEKRIGLYGFGAAAHILAQIALYEGHEIFAFTRPGDGVGQAFARSLGAAWAGGSDEDPPEPLDAAILFAPVGTLVPRALAAVRKGGCVVCAGIHMSEIPAFPYALLWGERVLRSVANLTRQDGVEFFQLAPRVPVRVHVETLPLERANDALENLRHGRIQGATALVP